MPAPTNDNFASAEALSTTLPGSLPGLTTFDATLEGSEPIYGGGGDHQSIWFTFTPTSSGWHRFQIPVSSLVYNGTHTDSWGEIGITLYLGGTIVDTLAETTFANRFTYPYIGWDMGFTDPGWSNVHNPTVAADLVSGTTYYIKVYSQQNGSFNRCTVDFDLEWDEQATAANQDFTSRQTITGSSGSEDVEWGVPTLAETDEPPAFYWNDGFLDGYCTVWYEWTAPSSGWFQFELDSPSGIYPELAIYTGSALNALTVVGKNLQGDQSDLSDLSRMVGKCVIRFNATASTVYKIQCAVFGSTAVSTGDVGELTWATASAPTQETTGAAASGSFVLSRVDNFGNTDDELPPDAVTRLSGHAEWWYEDGAVGRSKWWKYVAAGNGTMVIEANGYRDGFDDPDTGHAAYDEYALLVYKGANFGSLTDATTNGDTGTQDAVLIGADQSYAVTHDGNFTSLTVDFTTGETLWVCMVGLYDKDYDADTIDEAVAEDCPQRSIDLTFSDGSVPTDPPENDVYADTPNAWPYNLSKSRWGNYFNVPDAVQIAGTTILATADVGEDPHGGFGPERSVWYRFYVENAGDWKFWVESAVDCVLSVYDLVGLGIVSIGEDDDSGTGNWPELTLTLPQGEIAIAVDSKTEGDFVLKIQRQPDGGDTPPANDEIANAVDISSIPFTDTGTTVEAQVEPFEWDSPELGIGPYDSVWYKYVAPANAMLKVWCDNISQLDDWYVFVDLWHGDDPETMVPYPNPPAYWSQGVFYADAIEDPGENLENALTFPVESGETYYIRVQTESGGSEDFTIHVDEGPIYVDIQVSGDEEMHGTLLDDAEVYIDIQVSGSEIHHIANTTDADTVLVDIQPSGVEFTADEFLDSATVYVDIQFMGGECFSAHTGLMMDAEADPRWIAGADVRWQTMDVRQRWEIVDVQNEGVHC